MNGAFLLLLLFYLNITRTVITEMSTEAQLTTKTTLQLSLENLAFFFV